MEAGLQDGDNSCIRASYNLVVDFINSRMTNKTISLLNFGSGSRFNFERTIYMKLGDRIKLYSVDICDPVEVPSFIEFKKESVENQIEFDKRFEIVTFFELIEHIDKTDELLKNCYNNLKTGGYLICSCPNLASIWSRIELFLGFQPHILEASNDYHLAGMGKFGRINYGMGGCLHHIRGLTYKAMKELLIRHGFRIEKTYGFTGGLKFLKIPSLSSDVVYIYKKV